MKQLNQQLLPEKLVTSFIHVGRGLRHSVAKGEEGGVKVQIF